MSISLKLFLDAALFPLTSSHVTHGEKFEQQRRTAWRYVSSMKETCEIIFLYKRLFGIGERLYNFFQIQWLSEISNFGEEYESTDLHEGGLHFNHVVSGHHVTSKGDNRAHESKRLV